ncbi:MAG: exodeoxyribonuclease V subunit alpha [Desulfobacteraceae bacterium]|nr:exodeoxyribonuclease V subunit alpha [Desulfobacteraceae bacterium]
MERETTQFIDKLIGLGILRKETGADIRYVYHCSQKLELPFLDYMNIRDLVEMGGYEDDSPLLAVLIIMFGVLQEGSLCLDLDEEKLCTGLLSFIEEQKVGEIAREFLSGLSRDKYKGLITRNGDEYLPLILSETKGRKLLYFQKFYLHEKFLRLRIEALLTAEPAFKIPESTIEAYLEDIYSPQLSVRVSKGGLPIEQDKHQVEAIRLSLRSQFSIISGGPGTGKTFLMVNIIRCLMRAGIGVEEILLGAPTGRAAQRMTEAIQYNINTIRGPSEDDKGLLNLKGSTLHKILRYRSYDHGFYYGEGNPLPASVIILDEVSMVDVVMMEKFLRAVDPTRTKLIFLGDKDQLPSVEAGAVFAEMSDGIRAERFKGRLTVLEKTYRSGANLLRLAKQINRGIAPEYSTLPFDSALQLKPDKWAFVQNDGVRAWRNHIRLWTDYHYLRPIKGDSRSFKDLIGEACGMDHAELLNSDPGLEILGEIFNRVGSARVLSLVRNGIYGCTGINREVADYLSLEFGPSAWTKEWYFSGAVIMITRNDYSKEVFNGDVGVVIREGRGVYRAFFPRSGSYITFSMDLLPPWELAFAMTVHKSQGSEFHDVLLVLPEDEAHRLLTREIVYTGITRAKKRLIIYGTESGLNNALERQIERQSGLRW